MFPFSSLATLESESEVEASQVFKKTATLTNGTYLSVIIFASLMNYFEDLESVTESETESESSGSHRPPQPSSPLPERESETESDSESGVDIWNLVRLYCSISKPF